MTKKKYLLVALYLVVINLCLVVSMLIPFSIHFENPK